MKTFEPSMNLFWFFSFTVLWTFCSCDVRYCNEGLGVCTRFDCCSNSTTFNDGSGHIHLRFNFELETDSCHYLEMCCDSDDVIEAPAYYSPTNLDVIQQKYPDQVESQVQSTSAPDTKPCFPEFSSSDHSTKECVGICNDQARQEGQNNQLGDSSGSFVAPSSSHDSCDKEFNDCIPFFLCNQDKTNDGSGHLAARFFVEGGKCQAESQVCCSKKENLATKKPTACGMRNRDGLCYEAANAHDEAMYAEFPWMAALLNRNALGHLEYFCGGSLIHPRVVLTAAHCINDKNFRDLKIRLGEWDPQTESEVFPHSDHDVSQVVVHSDFGPANLYNDIALVVLKQPAQISMHVNTICLPPQNFKADQTKCTASGWGTDKFGQAGIYRANLKKRDLPLVALRDCQERLRSTQLGPRFRIHHSFMCAGGEEGVDTCTGDGGSPLVCQVTNHPDQYYQHGIVAWGIECGKQGVPGVYANVAKFRSWIDLQMEDLGFGIQSYSAQHVSGLQDEDYSIIDF